MKSSTSGRVGKGIPSAVAAPPPSRKAEAPAVKQPVDASHQHTVLFSKKGFVPPQLTVWARRVMDRKARTDPDLPYRKREPHQRNITQLLELARNLEAMPKREPFDVLAAIRNGDLVPTTDPRQLALERPAPTQAFRPATPHELKTHHDLLTSSRGKEMTFSDTQEVNGYFARISGRLNPFEAVPTAGEQLRGLHSYILDGNPRLVGGQSTLCNRLGDRVFGSRLEALHHLCFNTEFLRKAGPQNAAFYMGLYEQLTKEWKASQPIG